jgi:hypothetical protein
MDAVNDIDRGAMDGFVALERKALSLACHPDSTEMACAVPWSRIDVMRYHDGRDDTSWSLPMHLFMVSEWSAKCSRRHDPLSCRSAIQSPAPPPGGRQNTTGHARITAGPT